MAPVRRFRRSRSRDGAARFDMTALIVSREGMISSCGGEIFWVGHLDIESRQTAHFPKGMLVIISNQLADEAFR